MEISTLTGHSTGEAKVTSHYWGYRELTADEVSVVSGGDVGDYSDGGDRGYGDGAGYSGDGSNYAGATVDGVSYSTDTTVAGFWGNVWAGIVVEGIKLTVDRAFNGPPPGNPNNDIDFTNSPFFNQGA